MQITVKVTDRHVLDVLSELGRRVQNPSPALKEIGESIADSTMRRFATATSPDGAAWAPNSTKTTIPFYLSAFGGSYKKDGSLSKKGGVRSASKKPLTGETRALGTTINYQLKGAFSVRIGSSLPYAAMQQFGGITSPRSMIPGKVIPARPFLGISPTDRGTILDIVSSYLAK